MNKQTEKQQSYLNKYEARIYAGDSSVPTYAQYLQNEWNGGKKKRKTTRTSSTNSRLKNAGLSQSEIDKMR